MASSPEMPMYVIVDEDDEATIVGTAATEQGARKLAGELAVARDLPMYVYQKAGFMKPVTGAKWEGPGS